MVKKLIILSSILAILLTAETVLLLDYAYLRNDYVINETTNKSMSEELEKQNNDFNNNLNQLIAIYPDVAAKCGAEMATKITDYLDPITASCSDQARMVSGLSYEAFQSGIFRYKLQKVFNPLKWFSK